MGEGSYLQDKNGQTVMTKLNEDMCRKVAEAGKGIYIHVDNTAAAEQLLDNEIAKCSTEKLKAFRTASMPNSFPLLQLLPYCFLS